MQNPMNYFDMAVGIFFFFFSMKLVMMGFKELTMEKHERFTERPATWLQYSQPPLILIMIVMVYSGILTDYFRISVAAAAGIILRWTGLLMVTAGSALALSAIRAIGKDMQTDIAVNKGHVLRTRGAYAVVRHPMYLSLILLSMGAGLATLNFVLMGFALFVLAPVQFLRAKKEEELLSRHFGRQFRDYQKKTPMISPLRFR